MPSELAQSRARRLLAHTPGVARSIRVPNRQIWPSPRISPDLPIVPQRMPIRAVPQPAAHDLLERAAHSAYGLVEQVGLRPVRSPSPHGVGLPSGLVVGLVELLECGQAPEDMLLRPGHASSGLRLSVPSERRVVVGVMPRQLHIGGAPVAAAPRPRSGCIVSATSVFLQVNVCSSRGYPGCGRTSSQCCDEVARPRARVSLREASDHRDRRRSAAAVSV